MSNQKLLINFHSRIFSEVSLIKLIDSIISHLRGRACIHLEIFLLSSLFLSLSFSPFLSVKQQTVRIRKRANDRWYGATMRISMETIVNIPMTVGSCPACGSATTKANIRYPKPCVFPCRGTYIIYHFLVWSVSERKRAEWESISWHLARYRIDFFPSIDPLKNRNKQRICKFTFFFFVWIMIYLFEDFWIILTADFNQWGFIMKIFVRRFFQLIDRLLCYILQLCLLQDLSIIVYFIRLFY